MRTTAGVTSIIETRPESGADRARVVRASLRVCVAASVTYAGFAHAAIDDSPEWIQWAVLGAIALLVLGVLLRMILAARFPKGYGTWARSRREEFAERNAKWDADDEAKR